MKSTKKKTKEQFLEQCLNKFGSKYDYSKVEYINTKTKVCIICPIHGEFWQTPEQHLKGKGCPKCLGKNLTTQDWIKQANIVHNNKYIYSKTNFKKGHEKVIITCPIHGDFEQQATSHLQGSGCSKCNKLAVEASNLICQMKKLQKSLIEDLKIQEESGIIMNLMILYKLQFITIKKISI